MYCHCFSVHVFHNFTWIFHEKKNPNKKEVYFSSLCLCGCSVPSSSIKSATIHHRISFFQDDSRVRRGKSQDLRKIRGIQWHLSHPRLLHWSCLAPQRRWDFVQGISWLSTIPESKIPNKVICPIRFGRCLFYCKV